MRRIMGWLCGSAVAALVLLAAVARAEEVPVDKVPRAVLAAIQQRFPGAKITGAAKDAEDGQVVYDIELTHQGHQYEVEIHENGTLLGIDKEITAKDLPRAVARALEIKFPRATLTEVIEVTRVKGKKETLKRYEVTVRTADGKEIEVTVSPDGKTVTVEDDKE
jgi:uncharacterized membrane protein YkoI